MKLFGDKSKEIKELQSEEKKSETEEKKYQPPAKLPEIKKRPQPPKKSTKPSKSPPLFIKVDKYRSIIKNIRDLKSQLLNLRDALDVLDDIQKELSNGVQVAHGTIDELNTLISNLDSFFLKPQGVEPHMDEEDIPGSVRLKQGDVDNYMRDVHGQLERLRAQLRAMD